MSTETMEIVELCEALPAAKRAEVTDFARFLLGRSQGAYGLEAAELRSVSRRLHAKAQTARRKGTAKKFHGGRLRRSHGVSPPFTVAAFGLA